MANVLTNTGRAQATSALKATGYTEAVYVGWGTGAGTAAVADTTLFSEKAADLTATTGTRVTGTTSRVTTSVTNDTWQNVGTITATGAGTVTNAGCFDNSAIGSGNLFVKGDFTGVALSSGDSIQFTIKLQLS
jgi:hypothetical protein